MTDHLCPKCSQSAMYRNIKANAEPPDHIIEAEVAVMLDQIKATGRRVLYD